MHTGHKRLFFDRLDVDVAETAVPGSNGGIVALGAGGETPRLVPFAHAIYHDCAFAHAQMEMTATNAAAVHVAE